MTPKEMFYFIGKCLTLDEYLENNPAICDNGLMVVYVNKPVGTEELLPDLHVIAYPNPASENLFISSDAGHLISSLTTFL